jgi:hypothetical protein
MAARKLSLAQRRAPPSTAIVADWQKFHGALWCCVVRKFLRIVGEFSDSYYVQHARDDDRGHLPRLLSRDQAAACCGMSGPQFGR